MQWITASDAMIAAQPDAVRWAGLAVVTIGIVFAALLAIGFLLLLRRSRSVRSKPLDDDTDRRSNIALVRLDEQVASTTDELGFAVAQFGDEAAAGLAAALNAAKANLVAAFALRQQLDDAIADTPTQRREWTAKILSQCESSSTKLGEERTVFDRLRGLERRAPEDLTAVRALIDGTLARIPDVTAIVESLSAEYSPTALAPVIDNVPGAAQLLDSAKRHAADGARQIDEGGAVSPSIQAADRDARRAAQLLDEVEHSSARLAASSARLDPLVADARSQLADAKRVRDDPPDPAVGASVAGAIADVVAVIEQTLGPQPRRADPDGAIARVEATTDALDSALAGARNQEQRLSHAREALVGALFTARSQIDTTRAYIGGRRGGVGAEARTRLAEAERLLAIAERESDPVAALDTARSSATYSRDADALARYDLLR